VADNVLGPLGLRYVLAGVDQGHVASAAVVRRLGTTALDVVPGALGPVTRYPGRLDPRVPTPLPDCSVNSLDSR